MDRKGQLRNVAFGGAWSEQIADEENLAQSIALIEGCALRSLEEDLREDTSIVVALEVVMKTHPKGRDLAAAFRQAVVLASPGNRVRELQRIAGLFRAGVGAPLRMSYSILCNIR